ncbi:M12 family metallo-peptidase [Xanthomonadaceae bacterium XH05]|nr:M12 family metallo-peptidase [Xanthomonadaceae bacterium XH05]
MDTIRHKARTLIVGLMCLATATPALAEREVALHIGADDIAMLQRIDTASRVQVNLRDARIAAAKAKDEPWSLRRIEVYSDDAQLWVAGPHGMEPVARSSQRHYIGSRQGERIALSLTPDGKHGQGLLLTGDGSYRLEAVAMGDGLRLDGVSTDALLPDGTLPESDCMGGLDAPAAVNTVLGGTQATPAPLPSSKAATRRVTLAIDTDNEFMEQKFSNNSQAATNYVGALVAAMSAIYELDPGAGGGQLELQVGHLILRPSTTTDPYPSTPSTPIGEQLGEFGSYWSGNYDGVSRAFSLLLSGKSPTPNGAAGIAWILGTNNYCAAKASYGGHYSINRVFKFAGSNASNDAALVAHELGHNLGLSHTHCTNASTGAFPSASDTLDRCTTFEAGQGCYSGPVSCPTGSPGAPKGTLMSYCHMSTAGCGGNVQLFHPVQVVTLNNRLAAQPSNCVVPTSSPNQPPSISAPDAIGMMEDMVIALTTPLNEIHFEDPDAGNGSLTATFSVPSGTLAATGSGGVTVGGSTSARTLHGTVPALNAFIAAAKLTYAPVLDANGAVVVGISITDNGHTGTGGAQSASRNLTLNIAPVNDTPTMTAPSSLPVFVSGSAPVSGLNFADVDAGANPVRVTLTPPANVSVSGVSGDGVTVTTSGSSRIFNGALVDLNAYFASGNARLSGPSFVGPANLQVTLNDNGNTGNGGAKSVSANVVLRGGLLFANGFE